MQILIAQALCRPSSEIEPKLPKLISWEASKPRQLFVTKITTITGAADRKGAVLVIISSATREASWTKSHRS